MAKIEFELRGSGDALTNDEELVETTQHVIGYLEDAASELEDGEVSYDTVLGYVIDAISDLVTAREYLQTKIKGL